MIKVVVNGTFDIIHLAHIKLLNTARSMGDHLLVAIDSDRRIQELKGKDRPINNEYERIGLLINLKSVDEVKVFDTDEELENILKKYSPDVMLKGSDWKGKPIVGEQFCKRIEFFKRIDGYSTTEKIQDIINRR